MKNKKKIVFIIGGSGLLGKKIQDKLNRQKYEIINLDIKKSGKKFVYFDCSETLNLESKINRIIKKFNTPDVLINCSYPISKEWTKNNFKQLNISIMKPNINAHLLSYSLIANLIAKKMSSKKRNGKIILFSSIYGFLAQNLNNYKGTQISENVTYSLIKGGILSLVKQMAAYYGKYNIEINAISPGAVLGHIKGSKKKQSKKFIDNYSKNTPLKRLAKPDEIANLVSFLSSDQCTYITGQNIIIDGGYSII